MPRLLPAMLLTLLLVPSAQAAEGEKLPPIKAVKTVQPTAAAFMAAKRNKPLVLRSAKDAAAYFSKDDLAKLQKQVDFKRQFVVVFAWRGSGQDRLSYRILESFPEQIAFELKRGRTRDLRSHTAVYALRSNVKWRVK